MFTDTHFHIKHIEELGINLPELYTDLVKNNFAFVQDIGTKCDDLESRIATARKACSSIADADVSAKAWDMTYFSAGIWPDADSIRERASVLAELERCVKTALEDSSIKNKFVAIGECGLDHHWNASGVDHRSEADFSSDILKGETELFEAQLELARSVNKPVIIHSRDAFEDTLSCIKNVGYHNGEIHCFSYGKEEARKFLDLGWYIALGGAVTYTKKSKLNEMFELIRYIPRDRILLETDAPYLAPVPYRGRTNTPLFVLETYKYICQVLCMDMEGLGNLSFENAKSLFL